MTVTVLILSSPFILLYVGTFVSSACAGILSEEVDKSLSKGMSVNQAKIYLTSWGAEIYERSAEECGQYDHFQPLEKQSEGGPCLSGRIEKGISYCPGSNVLALLYFNEGSLLVKWRVRDSNAYL